MTAFPRFRHLLQYIKTSGRFQRVILFLPYCNQKSCANGVQDIWFGSSVVILRQTNKASPAGSVVAQKARVALN